MSQQRYPPGTQRLDTSKSPHPSLLRLSLIAIATTAILSTPTLAQTPVPVCCMATAISENSFLYIHGGFTSVGSLRTAVPQFFALDLSVETWSTSTPPWVWLPNVGSILSPTSNSHSMALSKDQRELFIWDPFQTNAWWTYTIPTRVWNNYNVPLNVTMESGIRSGVDLNSGNVFIPGGSDNGTQMIMNAPGNSSVPRTLMPTNLLPVPVVRESFIWSTYRSSFLHYGGQSVAGDIANPNLIEFSPTAGWKAVSTIGPSPGDVSGHCMVSAYSGTKMIVFGGAGLDGVANADIHILDLTTREWTLGTSGDATHARRNMACAISGDSFVAWGGESALENKNSTPIVYDIRNNQWTSLFRRNTTFPVPTGPSTPSITITSPTSPDTALNVAAIGGGVAGAILVAAIIGFLFYRRHKQTKAKHNNNSTSTNNKSDGFYLYPREPQNTNGDGKAGLPVANPPLAPRPKDDREEYFSRLACSPLTSSFSGPQGLLRDPHGQPQRAGVMDGDKSEWVDDNNDGYDALHPPPQRPPMPARISHLSDRTMTVSSPYQSWPLSDSVDKIDIQQHQQLQSPRNPQSPGSGGNFFGQATTEPTGPRGPQWLSQTNGSSQNVSSRAQHVDRNQYLGRSQELARMMEAIRAEQEELERSRLEHEALMQNYQDPHYPPDP